MKISKIILMLIITAIFSISLVANAYAADTKMYYVTTTKAELFSSPGKSLNKYLNKGTEVVYLSQNGSYYKVKYNSSTYFIKKTCLKYKKTIKDRQTLDEKLPIVKTSSATYTYEDILDDIKQLSDKYKNLITSGSIGSSVLKRDIPYFIIGNPDAPKKILIVACFHAREYMSAQFVMKQAEYYLSNYENGTYNKLKFQDILNRCSICYVPMLNPDGVSLAQKGLSSVSDIDIRNKIYHMNNCRYDFKSWKANANGVNLNFNYNAMWENIPNALPGPEKYKGPTYESEPETKSLVDFVNRNDFASVIAYHTCGSIIYWYFGQKPEEYKRDNQIAKGLGNLTGYNLVAPSFSKPGGFKDWFVLNKKRPGFTIEIGRNVTNAPLPISQFPEIFDRNKYTSIYLSYLIGY